MVRQKENARNQKGVSPSLKIMLLIQFFLFFKLYLPALCLFQKFIDKVQNCLRFLFVIIWPKYFPDSFYMYWKEQCWFYQKKKNLSWNDLKHVDRYVFAANAIVAIYSLFEMAASVWEISRNATLFPEICQVWFDFGHDQVYVHVFVSLCPSVRTYTRAYWSEWEGFDGVCVCVVQVFAYLLLSANTAGTELARTLKDTCTDNKAFCVQSDIAIVLGFAGFLFLGISSLFSGFRVVCFIINGSRFYV